MRNYKIKHNHQTRMLRPKLMRNFLRGDDYPGTYPARKHWASAARDIVRQIEQRKRDLDALFEARNERIIREALVEKPTDLVMTAGGAE